MSGLFYTVKMLSFTQLIRTEVGFQRYLPPELRAIVSQAMCSSASEEHSVDAYLVSPKKKRPSKREATSIHFRSQRAVWGTLVGAQADSARLGDRDDGVLEGGGGTHTPIGGADSRVVSSVFRL